MRQSFQARDGEEVHPDTEHSLVGQTSDCDFDRLFGTNRCKRCEQRKSPAELDECAETGRCFDR